MVAVGKKLTDLDGEHLRRGHPLVEEFDDDLQTVGDGVRDEDQAHIAGQEVLADTGPKRVVLAEAVLKAGEALGWVGAAS
ncbi:MAG: hypothetical protein V7607_5865 [Solirubrobacteraceae bacterium]